MKKKTPFEPDKWRHIYFLTVFVHFQPQTPDFGAIKH